MADRILRDELLDSDRWLDLPSDTARLAFVGFLLIADDFGNFEGGERRTFRFLHKFTQIKTTDASVSVIDALMACDLLRRYEVEDRELFHIPRFRPHRQYLVRKMPKSPWDDERKVGKNRRIENRGLSKHQSLAKKIVAKSLLHGNDMAEGVGVGVGEVQKKTPNGVYSLGVTLLVDQGLKESSARSFIASLLREWDQSTVEDAFRSAAGKEEVRSYVRAVLRDKPTLKAGGQFPL